MPKTPDIVAGEIITSTWGNEIRDRTRQIFTTLSDLTTNWPTAPVGAHAWLTTPMCSAVKTAAGWSAERVASIEVISTGSTGAATVTYPVPFTGVPVIQAIDGDASDTSNRQIGIVRANHLAASTRFVVHQAGGAVAANALVRIQWTGTISPDPA
jgi:hypothetical protein